MDSLFKILPDAITYLASGFACIAGFYFIVDRRFDFFSEISFSVILVLGFACTNFLQALPTSFVITDIYIRNVLIFITSCVIGLLAAIIRNTIGKRVNEFIIEHGRRKTSSSSFWYDRLDVKEKPIILRLVNYEQKCILQGVLLSIDEAKENPYLLLGYCRKFDLDGHTLDEQYASDEKVQCVVRADIFQEIYLIYDEESDCRVPLNPK